MAEATMNSLTNADREKALETDRSSTGLVNTPGFCPSPLESSGQIIDSNGLGLTGFRLGTIFLLLGTSLVKAREFWNCGTVNWKKAELVGGAIISTLWYFLKSYETCQPPTAPWFYQDDYSYDLLYLPLGILSMNLAVVTFYFALPRIPFDITRLKTWMSVEIPTSPETAPNGLILALLSVIGIVIQPIAVVALVYVAFVLIKAIVAATPRPLAQLLRGYMQRVWHHPLLYLGLNLMFVPYYFDYTTSSEGGWSMAWRSRMIEYSRVVIGGV